MALESKENDTRGPPEPGANAILVDGPHDDAVAAAHVCRRNAAELSRVSVAELVPGTSARAAVARHGAAYSPLASTAARVATTAGINAGKVLWVRVSAPPRPVHVSLVLKLLASDAAGGAVIVEMCVPLPGRGACARGGARSR